MTRRSRKVWLIPAGVGVLFFLIAIGVGQSGVAESGPEISIYYSPS